MLASYIALGAMIEPGVKPELSPGAVIGGHRLLFRVGRGGMGEVWAASKSLSAVGFEKVVAIKVVPLRGLASNDALMFIDEGRAASALQHGAIVPTFELGQCDDHLYVTMEWVRGPSLAQILDRTRERDQPMSAAIIAYVGSQLAGALEYAYERATFEGKPLKLIHRDISPHNVLVDASGAVRLTDFGIARSAVQLHKSLVGTVRGKPGYMSPEQIQGGDVDTRSDLFSLGVVLYELATREKLFGGTSVMDTMQAVLVDHPLPLAERVANFPVSLAAVIERMLQKDPALRPARAADVALELQGILRSLPESSRVTQELAAFIGREFPDDFALRARASKEALPADSTRAEFDLPDSDLSVQGGNALLNEPTRTNAGFGADESTGGGAIRIGDESTRTDAGADSPSEARFDEDSDQTDRTELADPLRSGEQRGDRPAFEARPIAAWGEIAPPPARRSGFSRLFWGGLALAGVAVACVLLAPALLPSAPVIPSEAVPSAAPVARTIVTEPLVEPATPPIHDDSKRRPIERTPAILPVKKRTPQPAPAKPTISEVAELLRDLKEVEPSKAKELYARLGEVGGDPVLLARIRDEAKRALGRR